MPTQRKFESDAPDRRAADERGRQGRDELPPARERRDLTGVERHFGEEEIIVSKTDLRGHITYANDVFLRVAGYREAEVLGKPHSLIRHPEMPRAVFHLLWKTLEARREIFAYVVNRAKNGDHYWVFAHVTPSYDGAGNVIGYHSNRRTPDRAALATIEPLYAQMLAAERAERDKAAQIAAGAAVLQKAIAASGKDYDELILSWS
jgi:PAS domain S-box-containing protein